MVAESKPKILYIDDTPEARSLVLRILSREYTLLEASDPLTGIELAIEAAPDLVLLDINLPNLSGREVAARLKTLLPNAVLVAFSADVSPGARERALAAGCVGYLTKPLDVDTFPDQIAEFLGGKRELIPNAEAAKQAFEEELVERLEEKVRELTKTAERNAFLNEQNKRLVIDLQRRQKLLEAAARVGNSITSILDLDELLKTTANVICEQYGFYYAGIFLLDPSSKWAVLHAGSGEAGVAMLAEGFQLEIGGQSLIGQAIQEHKAKIVLDVRAVSDRIDSPHLPKTRSEMALPLAFKGTVLGALSVQSEQVNAFNADDITAMQTLADTVAVAISNARLLHDLNAANHELLRTKTYEAIATATGEAIHWVGNKAMPIPSSARRVREDLGNLLAMLQALLALEPEKRTAHPFWAPVKASLEAAPVQGLPLDVIAAQLEARSPRQLAVLGGLESILEDLAIIEQSATTILGIKEDLIGPVRRQNIAELQLPELIRQNVFEMGLPDGVVRLEFAANLPPTRGDPRQIGQVYNNLIKNAWEALTSPNVNRPEPHIWVSVQITDDGRFLESKIRDNGPGIPPDLLDKIWVSFFTTKGDRGGTGLGLSACIAIINQAEGKILVESQVGVGTTFTVLLPVAS
jgi:signal transduction histidine kinase